MSKRERHVGVLLRWVVAWAALGGTPTDVWALTASSQIIRKSR